MFSKIDGVVGAQHLFGTPSHEVSRQQYATKAHANGNSMSPGLIVEAQNTNDIARTIQYAKSKNVAIATRTGGFMHWGLSSTNPGNIQLDMASAFKNDISIDSEHNVRVSVSHTIGQLNAYLGRQGLFVPHGNNPNIGLGGHVQTGGYGQFSRSFGLLGDHVTAFDIVNHNGDVEKVTRASNPDLFFAVLGGSPGNFGVLTHVTLKAHRDVDHAGSTVLKVVYPYTSATLERLTDLLVEMSDDAQFPRNYDLTVNVVDSSIVVYATHVSLEEADVADKAWFNQLATVAEPLESTGIQQAPVSEMSSWFLTTESFDLVNQSSLSLSDSHDLSSRGWSSFVTSRVDQIVAPSNGMHISCRLQNLGGLNSQIYNNANNGTSYNWRDSTLLAFIDCFHTPELKDTAVDWQRSFVRDSYGPSGTFADERRCLHWEPCENYNLDTTWKFFYDDREKYERLSEIRAQVDPAGTFTPNMFSVKRAAVDTSAGVPATMATGSVSTSIDAIKAGSGMCA